MVLTGLDRFFGGFLNFKISKRPRPLCLRPRKDRDHGPVLIRFSPVRSPVFYRSLRPDLETLVVATQQTFAVFAKIASLTQTTSHLSRSGPVLEYANIHVFYCPMMHGTMYTEYLSRNEFKVMDRTSDHKIHPTALLFLLKCQIHLQSPHPSNSIPLDILSQPSEERIKFALKASSASRSGS